MAVARKRRWAWIVLSGVLLAAFIASRVEVHPPRVHVRWHEYTTSERRAVLERRYDLRDGEVIDHATATWQYRLGTRSAANIRALIREPAVVDTGYINREALTADSPEIRFIWYPLSDLVQGPAQLLRLYPTAWLLLAGGIVVWVSRSSSLVVRRNVIVLALAVVGVMMIRFPVAPTFVAMGEWEGRGTSREGFEASYDGRVRYEKHLSQVILRQLYRRDATDAAPERAMVSMMRGVSAWFVITALVIGFIERWSPLVTRYIGLALLAPSTLLYFGWRELAYLSLSSAAFPLLVRGLGDDGMRIEAGSAKAGLGAALHSAGLVSLLGAGLAALGTSGSATDRVRRALRVTAWATAFYLGWIAIYMMVLKLPLTPDFATVELDPWRPWVVSAVRGRAIAPAILSLTGARDIAMSAWLIGVPLVLVAASLWRRHTHEVRAALWYCVPSVLFIIFRWPIRGIGGGVDLVIAGFPALYALAWVCAHDAKRTTIAALLLVSAHYAFWRVVLDERFNS